MGRRWPYEVADTVRSPDAARTFFRTVCPIPELLTVIRSPPSGFRTERIDHAKIPMSAARRAGSGPQRSEAFALGDAGDVFEVQRVARAVPSQHRRSRWAAWRGPGGIALDHLRWSIHRAQGVDRRLH